MSPGGQSSPPTVGSHCSRPVVLKLRRTLESHGELLNIPSQTALGPMKPEALGHPAGTDPHVACTSKSPGSFKNTDAWAVCYDVTGLEWGPGMRVLKSEASGESNVQSCLNTGANAYEISGLQGCVY